MADEGERKDVGWLEWREEENDHGGVTKEEFKYSIHRSIEFF